jgi:hypothetical protein
MDPENIGKAEKLRKAPATKLLLHKELGRTPRPSEFAILIGESELSASAHQAGAFAFQRASARMCPRQEPSVSALFGTRTRQLFFSAQNGKAVLNNSDGCRPPQPNSFRWKMDRHNIPHRLYSVARA